MSKVTWVITFCLFMVLMQTVESQHQLLTEKQVKHSLQVVGVPPDEMKVLDQKLIMQSEEPMRW